MAAANDELERSVHSCDVERVRELTATRAAPGTSVTATVTQSPWYGLRRGTPVLRNLSYLFLPQGASMLHLAVLALSPSTIQVLLSAGFNRNARSTFFLKSNFFALWRQEFTGTAYEMACMIEPMYRDATFTTRESGDLASECCRVLAPLVDEPPPPYSP